MAGFTVKLEFFYNAWKAIQDWITGASADKPKVEVDGTVEVSNLPTTQQVAGEVQVSNLPEVQQVTASEPLPVQNEEIEETLVQIQSKIVEKATEATLAQVKSELEAIKARLDGNFTGTVEVSNLPSTQAVEGEVAIVNFPEVQEVEGAVDVRNLPEVQEVTGEVQVTNLPEVQKVEADHPLPVQNDEIEEALVQIQSKIDDLEEALERIKFDTADISNDIATIQEEFGDLHQKLYDEPMPVSLDGNNATIKSAPVTGAKTITTTAAEVFAGASRLANRYQMTIQNVGTLIIYIGGTYVTTANGFPLLPGDSITLSFKPDVATPIYAISTGSCAVRVVELA